MKTKILSLVAFVLFGATSLFAQAKTETFKVYGNCGMCETRIEKAASDVEGVTSADWNKETKMLELTYESSKTDANKVQMAIAKVGHDTDMHKASDEVYNKLPGCCLYERPVAKSAMPMDMNHK